MILSLPWVDWSRRFQVSHRDKVVGGEREGERPPAALLTYESRLTHGPHRLGPSEDFLDALPEDLTDCIPGVPPKSEFEIGNLGTQYL